MTTLEIILTVTSCLLLIGIGYMSKLMNRCYAYYHKMYEDYNELFRDYKEMYENHKSIRPYVDSLLKQQTENDKKGENCKDVEEN